jgi:hypothetical protein
MQEQAQGQADMKPYAVYLLERYTAGETAEELARKECIPIERIRIRLAAAVEFERTLLAAKQARVAA